MKHLYILVCICVSFPCEQVGPPQAGMGPEAAKQMRSHLGQLLAGCSRGPPFTLQRFAELLLAPNKQYSRFDKLVVGLYQNWDQHNQISSCCGRFVELLLALGKPNRHA